MSLLDRPPPHTRVPPCPQHDKDCGVACIVNAEWLAGRRRAHPGALAYIDRRKTDYERAMLEGTLSPLAGVIQESPWESR